MTSPARRVMLTRGAPEDRVAVHLRHPNGAGGYATLCGWVDGGTEDVGSEDSVEVTCTLCIDVVNFCKRVKLKRVKT